MFAMGQLSGQVAALAISVDKQATSTDRLREELSRKDAELDQRVSALEKVNWAAHAKISVIVTIITFVLTTGVEYVIYNGWSVGHH